MRSAASSSQTAAAAAASLNTSSSSNKNQQEQGVDQNNLTHSQINFLLKYLLFYLSTFVVFPRWLKIEQQSQRHSLLRRKRYLLFKFVFYYILFLPQPSPSEKLAAEVVVVLRKTKQTVRPQLQWNSTGIFSAVGYSALKLYFWFKWVLSVCSRPWVPKIPQLWIEDCLFYISFYLLEFFTPSSSLYRSCTDGSAWIEEMNE